VGVSLYLSISVCVCLSSLQMCNSVHLFVCLSVCVFLFTIMTVYLLVSLLFCVSCLPILVSVYLPVCLPCIYCYKAFVL